MTLKEFFKPDWKKTVLFVVFVALSFVLGKGNKTESPVSCGILYELNPIFFPLHKVLGDGICSSTNIFDLNNWKSLFFECTKIGECRLDITNIGLYMITLIYMYFLPCLIVWSYEKYRKKKQK